MKKIKWSAMTQGKTVIPLDISFKKNTNKITISILSKRAMIKMVNSGPRMVVKFEQFFQLFEGLTVIGFQPETGYFITVKD